MRKLEVHGLLFQWSESASRDRKAFGKIFVKKQIMYDSGFLFAFVGDDVMEDIVQRMGGLVSD